MDYSRSQAKAYAREHMRGVWAAIPYPFTADDEIDEAGLRRNVSHYVENKLLDGIFCGHFMSEFFSLTIEERRRGAEIVIDEVRGRVPVVVQTGHHSAKESVGLTHHAEKIGATYACLGNPYFMAKLDDAIFEYFRHISDRTDIGVLISNAPFTGISLSPQLVNRLAYLENIVAIKNAQPLPHTLQTVQLAGDRIVVSDPDESRWFMLMVHLGFRLHMASPSPYLLQRKGYTPIMDYTSLVLQGRIDTAAAIAYKMEASRKLIDTWIRGTWAARSVMPIGYLKVWCDLLGMAGGAVRPPLLPVSPAERERLRKDLEGVGLI